MSLPLILTQDNVIKSGIQEVCIIGSCTPQSSYGVSEASYGAPQSSFGTPHPGQAVPQPAPARPFSQPAPQPVRTEAVDRIRSDMAVLSSRNDGYGTSRRRA